MGLIATDKGDGGDFTPCPAGVHIGVCYTVLDLGTQVGEFKGDATRKHEVYVGWEIPAELVTIERDGKDVEVPMTVGKFYTMSLNKKANLRKHLDAWRGKDFTEKELEGFDLFAVIGKACQIQVTHYVKADGKENAKVENIMALPKGVPAPKPVTPAVRYSISDGGEIPEGVKEGIVKIIHKSEEWQAMSAAPGTNRPDGSVSAEELAAADKAAGAVTEEVDEQLPF